jgi:hypothetical protein
MDMDTMEQQIVSKALEDIPILQSQWPPLQEQQHIEAASLKPKVVKPGEMIHCQIKLSGPPDGSQGSQVSFYIGDQIIEGVYDKQENNFTASWPGAALSKQYTVSAIITHDQKASREIRIGNYRVDGLPPNLTLQVKGQELNGAVILQKQVQIRPVLEHPEPISRWQIKVFDDEGTEVMGDHGDEELPSHFSWWGQGQNGGLVGDGSYAIALTVWDQAGNSSTSQEDIRVIRKKPEMLLAVEKRETSVAVKLQYDGEIPLAYWRLQVRNKDGAILAENSGTEIAEQLIIPLQATAAKDISYRIYAQDMLGNRVQREERPHTDKKKKLGPTDENFLADLQGKRFASGGGWEDDF